MIPEYKLYHGAVLTEIVHRHDGEVTIRDMREEGRPSSYMLNGSVAIQIKHASQRLHPWAFGLTKANLDDLYELNSKVPTVFIVFVCHTDGMACVLLDELIGALPPQETYQQFVRVDRRKGEWYRVIVGGRELDGRKPNGVDAILAALTSQATLR